MTPIWLAEPLIEVLVQPVQRVERLIIDPPINDGGSAPWRSIVLSRLVPSHLEYGRVPLGSDRRETRRHHHCSCHYRPQGGHCGRRPA